MSLWQDISSYTCTKVFQAPGEIVILDIQLLSKHEFLYIFSCWQVAFQIRTTVRQSNLDLDPKLWKAGRDNFLSKYRSFRLGQVPRGAHFPEPVCGKRAKNWLRRIHGGSSASNTGYNRLQSIYQVPYVFTYVRKTNLSFIKQLHIVLLVFFYCKIHHCKKAYPIKLF